VLSAGKALLRLQFFSAIRHHKKTKMNKKPVPSYIRSVCTFAFVLSLLSSGVFAQNPSRERTAPKPTQTPVPKPTVVITTNPTPTPAPTATPVVQTLSDLQARIQSALSRPEFRRGTVGIKIVSLNSGKLIFEQNGEKYVMPASNMKNFTVAAAMERLTPDFRFVTSVFAPSQPDANGTVKGDLRIYGRGDVSISTAFNNGDYYKGLDNLVDKIVAAGVKRVEGDLIGDESYFRGPEIPGEWEYDDLQWYYGAGISALPINDNAVDLTVKAGPVGYGCVVTLLPVNPVFRINNRCTTTASDSQETLQITKDPDQNVIDISGTVPTGGKGFTGSITVSNPGELFVSLLKQRLQEKGVTVTGQTRTISYNGAANPSSGVNPSSQPPPTARSFNTMIPLAQEIAKLESPPFSIIAAKTMKPSQNMYTETILRTLGEWLREKDLRDAATENRQPVYQTQDSVDVGLAATKAFRQEIGIPEDAVVQHDGSGLSRHDLITPSSVVQLYIYMAKQSKFAQAWRDALAVGGVDGTLRRRFAGTPAANNLRGKTGTIDQVSALSGYMTTAGGEPIVFSIVVNGVPGEGTRVHLIDEIVLNVANFNGKVD
jgi:D-alanyl-D-alanine carboxypeptidase/D-alanyl-D-alanine-endopeptidase (penicillin-binding protein 4)